MPLGYPEAFVREQPYLEAPLTRRASGSVRAKSSFPARDTEANERYRWRGKTTRSAVLRTIGTDLVAEDIPVSAGDERRHVCKNPRQFQAAWVRQIPRFPLRIELFLVRAQTLEVVDRFAVLIQE